MATLTQESADRLPGGWAQRQAVNEDEMHAVP